jgi:hypothetical protein
MRIAPPALSPARHHDLLPWLVQIGQDLAGVERLDDRAHRDAEDEILAVGAAALVLAAVLPRLRLKVHFMLER